MNDQLRQKISELPAVPGVYLFKNKDDEVIYVGKAVKLRSRVQSYFRENATLESAKRAMVKEIVDLQIYTCESEIEALILESQLIKKYDTRYNILMRDDKSYAYVAWTKEEFPRIFVTYKSYIDRHGKSLEYVGPFINADAVRKTLRYLRKVFPYRSCKTLPKTPCIYYRINRCDAPCIGNIQSDEYRENLDNIILFLKGKKKDLIKKLEKDMQVAAESMEYEKAGRIRDELRSLQKVSLHKGVIEQSRIKKRSYLEALKASLVLDKLPLRIEGFDSSHFQGNNPVVSMVVFEKGLPQKSEYRKFKIKQPYEGGNDFQNLREALERRFSHTDWPVPDLILIDGGKGQLSTVLEVQKRAPLPYQSVPIISLAKREEEVFVSGRTEPVIIPRSSKALQLLQQVRDESHRFAVTYHRNLREKQQLKQAKQSLKHAKKEV